MMRAITLHKNTQWRREVNPANSEVRLKSKSFVLLQQNPHHHMADNMEYMNSVRIRLGTWNIGTINGKGFGDM